MKLIRCHQSGSILLANAIFLSSRKRESSMESGTGISGRDPRILEQNFSLEAGLTVKIARVKHKSRDR
jgi:hypothetical protein